MSGYTVYIPFRVMMFIMHIIKVQKAWRGGGGGRTQARGMKPCMYVSTYSTQVSPGAVLCV